LSQLIRLIILLAELKYGKIAKHSSAKRDAKIIGTSVAQASTRQ
jgi:hypothetical protein